VRRLAPLVFLAFVACSGLAVYEQQQADMLFVSMNKQHGGVVTDAEWQQFLREVVTPRFPGYTEWRAQGSWMGQREDTHVLLIVHPAGEERAIREIVALGEQRLDQEEVFVVREDVWRPMSQLRAK